MVKKTAEHIVFYTPEILLKDKKKPCMDSTGLFEHMEYLFLPLPCFITAKAVMLTENAGMVNEL